MKSRWAEGLQKKEKRGTFFYLLWHGESNHFQLCLGIHKPKHGHFGTKEKAKHILLIFCTVLSLPHILSVEKVGWGHCAKRGCDISKLPGSHVTSFVWTLSVCLFSSFCGLVVVVMQRPCIPAGLAGQTSSEVRKCAAENTLKTDGSGVCMHVCFHTVSGQKYSDFAEFFLKRCHIKWCHIGLPEEPYLSVKNLWPI